MRLTDYLREDLVLADLDASGLTSVVHTLAEYLNGRLPGLDPDELEEALLERERAHTTAMEQGVAIPHATISGLDAPVLSVARARDAVAFGPPESEPVWIFFVLLSPPGRERDHIKLLARICRLVRDPGFLDGLRGAEDADEMVGAIRGMDEQHV